MTRPCPICGASETASEGPILHPQPTMVAGVPLELGDTRYQLIRCRLCGFQFKDPAIDSEKLLTCYQAADSDNWQESPDPQIRQFDRLLTALERHAKGRRVLDVGCFNGAMLDYFGERWDRFGIEPSRAAAALAGTRGVQVLADTLDQVSVSEPPFDAIFAIDVLEHVVEPVPFFRSVADRLSPGGVFIALTGNTDALAWRMQSSMYWYCSLPEHVSFYNRASVEKAGQMTGLDVVECRDLCHKRMPLTRRVMDTFKSTVYVAGRTTGGFGLPPLRRIFVERRGPSIQSAKDHLLCVLRKR